jgi:hypothetical protein
MDKKIFDDIFDSVIEAIQINKAYPKYAVSLCDDLKRSKIKIYKECYGIEQFVATMFTKSKYPAKLVDRHKYAACFMIAFLNGLHDNLSAEDKDYPKERLAIFAGLTALRTLVEYDSRQYNNSGIRAVLAKNKGFKYPPTISGNISYARNWALELHHAHKEDRLYVLSLSHELFYIEAYNRLLAEP